MSKEATSFLSRRTVFVGAGSVGALAAVAAALPRVQPVTAAPSTGVAESTDADGRYQATAHVLRYYQTTRV